jgi:serine/threonine-protein kinase RsbW
MPMRPAHWQPCRAERGGHVRPDCHPCNAPLLKLANDPHQLSVMAAWLHDFAARCKLPDCSTFALDLVLTEAVTNIMDHSRWPDATGEIDLTCTLHDDQVVVEISDDGPAYDPTARSPTVLPTTLAEAQPGGLGVHLMRQYTRSMHYRRENERNILSLTLPLDAAPAPR